MNLFEQIKLMYNTSLYEDVKTLSTIALSLSEGQPEILSCTAKVQILIYHGDACYYDRQYKYAESLYRKALHMKRMFSKTKGKTASAVDVMSDLEVKYKLYLCYVQMKQLREAIAVLEGINAKQRNAKVNMALAKLYHRMGQDRSAITSYKEVLRECPMSLEAAKGLLGLWVKGSEIITLMTGSLSAQHASSEWLSLWIKAQASIASKDFNSALISLKQLETKPTLRDNIEMLGCLADAQHLSGDYIQATSTLSKIHFAEPLLLRRMDGLAALLYKQNNVKELEQLATNLMQITESLPEPWVAMGYYSMATRKPTKAVYFAQKAYTLDNWNIESLLLKGTALLDLNKIQDSLLHFKEALKIDSARYEAHKGLVDCYVAGHRVRGAITCAGDAYRRLGQTARSLTLVASVLAKEPLSLEKAKSYLEKAMKLEPSYLDAVYCMTDILWQQQQYDKGIDLLSKTLRQQSTSRLHQLLGDFLSHNNEHQEALDQYSIALSLDSANSKAREGLERVEKLGDVGMDSTYDVEVDDMGATDNEGELDGSDMESAWSDIDLG